MVEKINWFNRRQALEDMSRLAVQMVELFNHDFKDQQTPEYSEIEARYLQAMADFKQMEGLDPPHLVDYHNLG